MNNIVYKRKCLYEQFILRFEKKNKSGVQDSIFQSEN